MSDPKAALIYCPCPEAETARGLAKALLAEKLIACANIQPQMESIYIWEGDVNTSQEVAVIFKTTQNRLQEAVARLGELHPYDTPAILASVCDTAYPGTLTWLVEETR